MSMLSNAASCIRQTLIVLVALAQVSLLSACATLDRDAVPEVVTVKREPAVSAVAADSQAFTLKVMTLNVAHARSTGFHQLLQSRATAIRNLDHIAAVIARENPSVVALQEVDGPSFWNGNFNHLKYLADQRAFYQYVHGKHVDGMRLSYGTALLSNIALADPRAVTFSTVPTSNPKGSVVGSVDSIPKGFVVASITWPGDELDAVDIVSVHFDPSRGAVRRQQALELAEIVSERNKPVILMGDFNDEWGQAGSILALLVETLDLNPYKPDEVGLATFPRFNKRLDWILVSPEFEFVSYKVVPDSISDHLAVVAQLSLTSEEAM